LRISNHPGDLPKYDKYKLLYIAMSEHAGFLRLSIKNCLYLILILRTKKVVDIIKWWWFKINVNNVDGLTLQHFWQNALKLIGICRTRISGIRGRIRRRERIIQEVARNLIQVLR